MLVYEICCPNCDEIFEWQGKFYAPRCPTCKRWLQERNHEQARALGVTQIQLSEEMVSMESTEKQYIGDGVYVDFDGLHIVLTTENGIATTNTVYLCPETLSELEAYIDRLRKQKVLIPRVSSR